MTQLHLDHRFTKSILALFIVIGLLLTGAYLWRQMGSKDLLVRAWELAAQKRWDRVARELESYLRWHGQDDEAIALLAKAYSELNQPLASAEQWERVSEGSSGKRLALFEQGIELLAAHHAAKAEQVWLHCLELTARDNDRVTYYRVAQELATLYWLQGRKPDIQGIVASWLDRAYDEGNLSEHLNGLIWQLRVRLLDMDPTEAIDRLRKFVERNELDDHSRRALGRHLTSLGYHDEAQASLRRCLAQNPHDLRNWFEFLVLMLDSGELENAGKIFKELPELATDSPHFQAVLGRWAAANGDEEGAISTFRRMLLQNPRDERALTSIINIMRRGNQADQIPEHLALLNETIDYRLRLQDAYSKLQQSWNPDLVESVAIARLCDSLGYSFEAAGWWRRASALNPATVPDREHVSTASPHSSEMYWPDPPSIEQLVPASRAPAGSHEADALIRFVDVADRAGIGFSYFRGETGQFWIVEPNGGGAAWLDARQNGWLDLFFVNGSVLLPDRQSTSTTDARARSSRFYRNNSEGGFDDCTNEAGLVTDFYGQGCAVADFDNDGFPDLYLTAYGDSVLFHNQGDGTFVDVTAQSGAMVAGFTTGCAFADLNRDGVLDLYVVTYVGFDPAVHGRPCRNAATGAAEYCGPRCCPGQPDVLFMGLGDGTFVDSSAPTGVADLALSGFAAVAADLNNDEWPDLYVANDGQPNTLWLNESQNNVERGIRLRSCGLEQGCALDADGIAQASMGVACGDFDGDGFLDLGVTNYYHEHFTLYRNLARYGFEDVSIASQLAGPTRTTMGWGTQFVDCDNDGWLDLFIANGHINRLNDLRTPYEMVGQIFRNLRGGKFVDAGRTAGPYFQSKHVGRGAASGDYDNDGLEDIAVVHHHASAALLHNETATNRVALVIKLVGRSSCRDAWNARVTATIRSGSDRPLQLIREITSGTSYLSANDCRIRFGIDQGAEVDIRVQWPGGHSQTWHALKVGGTSILRELQPGVAILP